MGQEALPAICGAEPLSKPYHERAAQLRSLGLSQWESAREAAREIGRNAEKVSPPNARKLFQKRHIKDRVAYLSRQEQAVLEEKRRILEERQWLWHEADIGDFYEVIEEPWCDPKGNPVLDAEGNPLLKARERLRPISTLPRELRACIESLTWTDSGKPNLKLYRKDDANKELRKINGIDAAPSIADGEDHSRMSDKELFAELAKQASELGVNLKMTFEAMVE